jgi:acetyl-CoA hydrolase
MSWLDSYRSQIVTADEAVEVIKSNDRVYVHPGCAVPTVLVSAMVARYQELANVEIVHLLTMGGAPYVDSKYEGHFRHNAFFIGKNVRAAVNEGRADFIPIFLYDVPGLFYSGEMPIDVALVQLSPPDEHGFLSFGIGVECTKPAAENAKIVIAEVNEKMPRALGDSFIHFSKLKYIVETSRPLVQLKYKKGLEVHKKIGKHVADLIEDGSVLQMGIGGIPDAVLHYLWQKKDLGIHTEMFSDGVVPLVEAGVINNEKKSLHRGKIVASFVLGTEALYDFVDNNPLLEFHPTQYTNDPFIISRNDKMIAINSAIQVDLTGQVCADSIGHQFYSGFGGQVDFIRGAARSEGGKPIIALASTAKDETVSRIVPFLSEGAGVVTTLYRHGVRRGQPPRKEHSPAGEGAD